MRIFRNKMYRLAVSPLAALYGSAVRARNVLYDRGFLAQHRVGAKVISIGNISVGGTGKTPVTMAVAQLLLEHGCRPAVLSRGYGRQGSGIVLVSRGDGPLCSVSESGDEPYVLAEKLRRVPVCVAGDRVAGARHLIEACSPQVIVLDDGFQHRRLHRDLDIVLVDTGDFFANNRVLPAGPYREPASSLARADLVLVTDRETGADVDIAAFAGEAALHGPALVAGVSFVHTELFYPGTGKTGPLTSLIGEKVLPVCGLARPEQFAETLRRAGAVPAQPVFFRDHVHYTERELAEITRGFYRSGASWLVTTRKDWVKLAQLRLPEDIPVAVLEMRAKLSERAQSFVLRWLQREVL